MPRSGSSPSRVAPVGRSSRVYLPVSQPPPSGDHGSSPSPVDCAGRHDLPLDLADEQVVLRLQRHRAAPARGLGEVDDLLDLPAGEVGQPDVGDLAGAHGVVEEAAASPRAASAGRRRAPGRGRRARPRAGAARRPARRAGGGARARRRSARRPSGSGPWSRARPGRGPRRAASASQRPMISSERAAAVDVGGVDQRAAGLDEGVELRVRARLVGLVAERHRAEREGRHGAAAAPERAVLHGHVLPAYRCVSRRRRSAERHERLVHRPGARQARRAGRPRRSSSGSPRARTPRR